MLPMNRPSSSRSRRDMAMDSSLVTWMTSSMRWVSRMLGIRKPAPIPWILCIGFKPPGEHGAVGGFDGDTFELRLFGLDVAAHAGERPAGADPGDENVHLAVGVIPDLRAGRRQVNGRVGGIVELLEDVAVGGVGEDLVGLGDGTFHTVGSGGGERFRRRRPLSSTRRSRLMVSGMVRISL